MCYDINARPPDPPGALGDASGQDFVLTAQDGCRFAAFFAQPAGAAAAQVLIYPDVRGLFQFYKDLALRFAQVGIGALALDYFGRTAGLSARDESFEYMPHVQQCEFPTFMMDVAAGLDYLRRANPNAARFTMGFCFGGGLSLRSGTQDFDLAGVIAFYAGLGRALPGAEGTPLDQAHKIRCPVLGLFGGADQGIPIDKVEELDAELDKAGVEHEIVIYPGAPHSFFDRKQTEFASESADAWTRVLEFIRTHSKGN